MNGVEPSKNSEYKGAAAAESSVVFRTYQTWKGNNIFFLGGRLIFGPDVSSVFITIFLIVAPVAVFCIFVARKLMDDFADNWGISILVVVIAFTVYVLILLLLTSGRDPGIIPRNAHPPEPDNYEGSMGLGSGQTPSFPRTKVVIVNGMTVKTKYCDTCMLYRPPRCSHCSTCDNCVERFDHHCPWVGQCIGLRNYRFFFMFIFSTTLLCFYVHGFCWVYVRRIMDSERTSIWKAMTKTPASIVLIIYTFLAVWFVGGLSVFHLYLISTNQSTYENFSYRYNRRANPFHRGVVQNFLETLCSSIPVSKNKFREKVQKESGQPPRIEDGGFVRPNFGKAEGDIKAGRNPVWKDAVTNENDYHSQDRNGNMDSHDELQLVSPQLTGIVLAEEAEGQSTPRHRSSSWGRRSGSWDIPPEVVAMASKIGDSDRITLASSGSLTTEKWGRNE